MDEEKYLELVADITKEFPGFSIQPKSTSRLMRACNVFLKVITFGQMKRFMTSYFTTIGYTVYAPESRWSVMSPPSKASLLRHERVHMRQRSKYGMLLYSFLYLLFPLPTLLAWYRLKFEREAYAESIRAWSEYYGLQHVQNSEVRRDLIRNFTGADYFWTWPWRGHEEWYDGVVDGLRSG